MKNIKLSYAFVFLFFGLGCYYAFLFSRYLNENRFVPLQQGEYVYIYDKQKKIFYLKEYEGYVIDSKGFDGKFYGPGDLK